MTESEGMTPHVIMAAATDTPIDAIEDISRVAVGHGLGVWIQVECPEKGWCNKGYAFNDMESLERVMVQLREAE